uniref:Oxidase FUB9 n=2 Tax=Bionectria ochroleuca TaxID=29856 RepID=A0A0B7K1V3_BIOOC
MAHDLNCLTISELEALATQRLDKQTRDYYNEGADDGITVKENMSAYQKYRLRPRVLRNVSNVDSGVDVFGTRTSVPFGVAPAAMQKLAHQDGELATARACRTKGVALGLSSFSTINLEDVGSASGNVPNVLQLYLFEERSHSIKMIQRAKEAGYKAIVLTVDTPLLGRRNLEIRNQFRLPGHLKAANFASESGTAGTPPSVASLKESSPGYHDGDRRVLPTGPVTFHSHGPNPTLTWEEAIPWLKKEASPMQVWVKGIVTAEDALLAVSNHVDGIIVSNHGGRQLDGTVATLDALPEIVKVVDHRIPVHVDGGIRHGTDVFKALALGADFCWVGRPVLWGLGYGGEAGVELCLRLLTDQFRLCMGLCGVTKVSDIGPQYLLKEEAAKFWSRLSGYFWIGNRPSTNVFVPFYYHKYLQVADLQHLSPSQIHNLELEGCFQVPSQSVLNEFIRQYFIYVHPCLPLVNERTFWSIYSRTDNVQRKTSFFSLALFQAMLFAATRFVPINMINACGFEDLRSARNAFYRRAELLLAHNLERDSFVLAQTCLLLSLQATLFEPSLNSTWLSKAISHAEHAGANKYFSQAVMDAGRILENKRLWWCCILRDRMIAVGVRRSIQVTPDRFDFTNPGLEEADLAEEIETSEVYSPEMKNLLVRIIVAQCALAVAMTWTMTIVYPTGDFSSQSRSSTVSQLVTSMVEIERGNTELAVWARRFKTDLTDCIRPDQRRRALESSATVFADMTLIHYYSTQVALYNHLALVLQKHQSQLEDYEFRFHQLKSDLQLAITNVTDRFKGLTEEGLVQRLPISAPPCSALPVILENLDLKLSSWAEKASYQRQLRCSNDIIALLDDQHDYTECVNIAINSLLPVADAEIQQFFASWNGLAGIEGGGTNGIRLTIWSPTSWSDVFSENPMIYLRLSMSLDFALSRGKAPQITDLPEWTHETLVMPTNLHLISPSMTQMALPEAVLPPEEELHGLDELNGDDAVLEEPSQAWHVGQPNILRDWPFVENIELLESL